MLQALRYLPIILLFCLGCESSAISQVAELAGQSQPESQQQAQKFIDALSRRIEKNPSDTDAMVKLGNTHFALHEFEQAIEYYDRALKLDDKVDAAYFGRGMALGRSGFIQDGIKDLSVYIERHPGSSLAYTKRGVRHLWLGEEDEAMADFLKAIELDPTNAEANDDLGVIYAKRQQYPEAITHFANCVQLDPTYQKGHHNLAMAYFLVGQDTLALDSVDVALSLKPQDRSSMLLKAQILIALGRSEEAKAVREEAAFLPEGNWSETISVQ